jgi:hypothetical protein
LGGSERPYVYNVKSSISLPVFILSSTKVQLPTDEPICADSSSSINIIEGRRLPSAISYETYKVFSASLELLKNVNLLLTGSLTTDVTLTLGVGDDGDIKIYTSGTIV